LVERLARNKDVENNCNSEKQQLIQDAIKTIIEVCSAATTSPDDKVSILSIEGLLIPLTEGAPLMELVLMNRLLSPAEKLTYFVHRVGSWRYLHERLNRYKRRNGRVEAFDAIPALLKGCTGESDPNWLRLVSLVIDDLEMEAEAGSNENTFLGFLFSRYHHSVEVGEFSSKACGLMLLEIVKHYSATESPLRLAFALNQLRNTIQSSIAVGPEFFEPSWEVLREGVKLLPENVRRAAAGAVLLAMPPPPSKSRRENLGSVAELIERMAEEAQQLLA